MSTPLKEKSLPLAIGLNLVLPGAGYIYMGRVILGLAALCLVSLVVVSTGLLLLLPTWLGINAIMAIDMVILFNKRRKAQTRRCPRCAEEVQLQAEICKHCRSDLPPLVTAS
ncbi:MAG: hypothetical protein Q8L86_10240 [Vicinamibacterales bacterium]|nr:hypothetical protein [Vicinamibacterales bacterium]